jgi:hypothetical protein
MTGGVAHDGGEQEAGHYHIGYYALEEAERMYEWTGGELVWRDPGDELRKWFGHEADRWAGFLKRYRAELEEAGKTEELREIGERAAERNVTLLLGAKDTEHNNARGSRPSCASSVVQRRGLGN